VLLDDGDLVERFRAACGGDGPTLVVDPLWGAPVRAAADAAAPGARIVNIGQSAGPEASLTSAAVRGKQLTILGYSDFALSREDFRAAYGELAGHLAAGRIAIETESYALEEIAEAWSAQAASRKAVVRL
jgi:NADPH:quinone reductase-like Zn-dependent oxidoreductase